MCSDAHTSRKVKDYKTWTVARFRFPRVVGMHKGIEDRDGKLILVMSVRRCEFLGTQFLVKKIKVCV